ncbi:MAG: UDP-N-acetylmuramoyl-L-alanyl-D-glutamate--2,6-diaminopimelate ligase [Anaerolineae bacterium]|nr:UDP-N-acetylmuramoyl-L-alanyl-D-glutamate--2,6-diaminopimelate ligase [Anaerolineae bacterium]
MSNQKSLQHIFAELPLPFCMANVPDIPITGISIDSRIVKPGHLFVALKGGNVDGHDYIQNAIDNGAVAVVGEVGRIANPTHTYIGLENPRRALTWIAAAFYNWPGRKLTVLGVTGTDGKTTTTNLIYQILLAAKIKAGMISTVNAVIGDEVLDTGFHVTTPDAHDVQRYLARMVEAGLTHVVLETTSHGWSQYRVDACEFDIGIVTNITHEHMDEHGNYENYRAAKARLFSSLEQTSEKPHGNPRLGIINRDDARSFDFLNRFIKVRKLNYGLGEDADVRAVDIEYSPSGIRFTALSKDFSIPVSSKLVGTYNVSNCLAALTATVYGLKIKPEIAAQGIASLEGIPGRMERIDMGQNFTAIVDFAHTPNALKVTLETARKMLGSPPLPFALSGAAATLAPGASAGETKRGEGLGVRENPRVIAVFGSAGLRDKEKRRMMAEISAELADLTVLTAEDPRTESLDRILEEMAAGARPRPERVEGSKGGREGETFWRVPDRGEAIKFALTLARPGDIVLSCGKGHEQSMCFGAREFLWDDRTAMRAALSELLRVEGPKMPYLPTQDTPEEEWLKF